jgi:hypothetical protein
MAEYWANNGVQFDHADWGTCTAKEVEIKKACIEVVARRRKLMMPVLPPCYAFQVRMELKCSNGKSGRAFWELYDCGN